jgi:hypothetical protein
MLRSAAGKDMGDANGTAPGAQTGIAAFAHARKHSPITDPLVSFGRPSGTFLACARSSVG